MASTFWTVMNSIATFVSVLSICGACYVIRNARDKKKTDKENRHFLVTDYVYYLCILDLITHAITLVYWATAASGSNWIYNIYIKMPALCECCAFIFQFSLIASATWSFAIAINLMRLMRGSSPVDLMSDSGYSICSVPIKINHCIIWTVSIICALIPITNYGITLNPDGKYECWIDNNNNPEWTMALYVPILIYIVITIMILFWIALAKCGIVRVMDYGTQSLQNSLFAYSFLFAFIWFWPTLGRYWTIFTGRQPDMLLALHHIFFCSMGFGNFIIWTFIYPMEEKTKLKLQVEMEQIDDRVRLKNANDEADEADEQTTV